MQGKVTRTPKLFSSKYILHIIVSQKNQQKILRIQKYFTKKRKSIKYLAKILPKN